MTQPPDPKTGLALLKHALDLPTQVLDLGCGLVRDLVGEPVKVAGGMLSDQVYAWQWTNRVRIAHRAAEIMEKDGIARRIVPPSFLLPLLDSAGNVEDPELQELWAQLLASGVAADEHQHPMWVKILAQMSAEDAREFKRACAEVDSLSAVPPSPGDRFPDAPPPSHPSHARLEALGLGLMWAAKLPRDLDNPEPQGLRRILCLAPTHLGEQFRCVVMPAAAAMPKP